MALIEVKTDKLSFFDTKGRLRVVRGCPLTKLDELHDTFHLLYKTLEGLQSNDFTELCKTNLNVREIASHIATLAGIQSDWIDLHTLTHLVWGYVDTEGNEHPGYLVELYYPKSDKPKPKSMSWGEFYTSAIASLVGLHDGNVKAAYEAAETIPWNELEAVLDARAKQLKKLQDDPDGLVDELEAAKAKWREVWGEDPDAVPSIDSL